MRKSELFVLLLAVILLAGCGLRTIAGSGNLVTREEFDVQAKVLARTRAKVDELERLVDSGEYAVAFAMYPTSMDDVIKAADAGEVMPPKSTWFEPKLRSGLIVRPLSDAD